MTANTVTRITATLILLHCDTSWSYEAVTHRDMASAAVFNSVLTPDCGQSGQPACFLPTLGLPYPVDDQTQAHGFPNAVTPIDATNPKVVSGLKSVIDLIRDGAMYEDSCARSPNHFYDPVHLTALNPFPLGTNYTSPDWALEDTPSAQGIQTLNQIYVQSFSYAAARQYLFSALTSVNTSQDSLWNANQRQQSWGLAFQSLGQVIHHLQDMAQPQHVRNDSHWDGTIVTQKCTYFGTWSKLNPLYNKSWYETYTGLPTVAQGLTALQPPYSTGSSALDLTVFTTPRSLWTNGGKGIAEFTNANFFSAGTNVGSPKNIYSSPALDPTLLESDNIQTLCPSPMCPSAFTGTITFYGNQVTDPITGTTTPNNRATTDSVFSADLQTMGKSPLYTLNRFNFDVAHSFLIGRAVTYSAALINYFFRGQMTISLPDAGVYAVMDHLDPNNSDPSTGGFTIVRLKVQNVTPDGEKMVVQGAPTGNLYAVAKYHINTCYAANLSGEYGSPGKDWNSCRDPSESISVSQAMPTPAGIDTSPQEIIFTFPNKIPIKATDLSLQVVYQGQLGLEPNAVVVATKDISEPTYAYQFRYADAASYCYPYPNPVGGCTTGMMDFAQWCQTGGLDVAPCQQAQGLTLRMAWSPTMTTPAAVPTFDSIPQGTWESLSSEPTFNAPNPLVVATVPVGSYSRLAILQDVPPYLNNVSLLVTEFANTYQWNEGTPAPIINQLDPNTGAMTISLNYVLYRGIYVPTAAALPIYGTPGPLQPVPSQIGCAFQVPPTC